MGSGIEVRLLGPLEMVVPGGSVEFEGAEQKRLVAALAMRAPEAMSDEELARVVWGDGGGERALLKEVTLLGERVPVRRRDGGYALEVDREAIDCRRFEVLLEQRQLEAALALWRGPPLADHRFDAYAQSELGRLRGKLMLALYHAGRQAEALELMREGREQLVDELGLEPGPELRRLERMILAHDPELSAGVLEAPLPAPANATIGREGELAEIGALLTRPDVRLLTLLGTGGVGKTRLALEAGRALAGRFAGGTAYVNLAGVEDAAMLMPAAASALGVVAETPAELGDRLARVTSGAGALLVLDGFERFLADAAQVAELLAAAPELTVLATSRAPLRLTAEHAYRVLPLVAANAAALFTARVAAARPDWAPREKDPVVAEICERLDGLPLAIELAADRARLLPLPALLERLDQRLELLSGGPRDLPERQRSLRATLEWSWEALEPAERTLLARLCVFEGGASLEAFDAVCNPEGGPAEALLAAITDKTSLVVVEAGIESRPRLAMLDTVREFAAEHVAASGELILLELRHAQFFLEYAERAAEQAARADRRVWLSRLALERGNLRVAFERLLRMGAAQDALRIAIAFARTLPWDAHAHVDRDWLKETLKRLPPEPSARRAAALYWDGQLALSQARFEAAAAPLEQALLLARELGEQALEGAALTALGRRAVLIADPSAADLCEAAVGVARDVGEPGPLADALVALAGACERAQQWERAAAIIDEALILYRQVGDPYGVAGALGEQGFYDMVHGRLERSEQRLSEAIELRRQLGDDRRLVEPMIANAWLDLARGSGEAARRGFLDCLALARHVGDQFNVAEALAGLSTQAALDGQHEDAARLAGASAALHTQIGAPPWESLSVIHERALQATHGALGEDGYAALSTEGRRPPAGQVVARSHRFVRSGATRALT